MKQINTLEGNINGKIFNFSLNDVETRKHIQQICKEMKRFYYYTESGERLSAEVKGHGIVTYNPKNKTKVGSASFTSIKNEKYYLLVGETKRTKKLLEYKKNEDIVNVLMKCSNRSELLCSIVFDVKKRYNLSNVCEAYHKIFGTEITINKGNEKYYYERVAKNEKASRLFLQKCYENVPEIMVKYEEFKDMFNL